MELRLGEVDSAYEQYDDNGMRQLEVGARGVNG